MSSGCGDVLSLEDLKTAKKHQTFEAEVITGKAGGVASGADIDYATNQVTGQVQKTLPAVLRDAGFRPASFTFTTGGTLTVNDADLAVLWPIADGGDGNYYAWKGTLPKTIPAGSTPAGTGGINSAGWVAVSEAALRTDLAKTTGSNLVGTNHRGTLQQDLDAIDIRTSGQDISVLIAAGSDIEVDTQISTTVVTGNNSTIQGKQAGSLVTPKETIGLLLNANDTSVKDLTVSGDGTVNPSNTSATYLIRTGGNSQGQSIQGNKLSDATMGVHVLLSDHVNIVNNETSDMVYHPSLNAGGYGILTEGAHDVLILGGSSTGTVNDRHAIYISNEPTLRANKDVRIIGHRADYSGASSGGVYGARNMPMINVRITDGLIIDSCQLRGGGSGISLLNFYGPPQTINISNNQIIDITKSSADDGCVGIANSFTTGNNPIVGLLLSNNYISIKRASGVTDGVRKPQGISLSNVRNLLMVNNTVTTPPDSYPVVLDTCRDVNINNLIGLPGAGSGTALELIRFEGSCLNVSISGISWPNRPNPFSNLDAVTNLTVDFQRMCEVYYNAGTLSTVDPQGLISSVSLSGSNVVVALKSHVTQAACDTAQTRPMLSTSPINIITGSSSKTITVAAFTGANVQTSPTTGQVRFKIILSQ